MLPWEDLRALLMPPSRYYRRRIAVETLSGEPELAILAELMPRRGTALDIGADQGFFAYALASVADRVLAFEANPDYALFSRIMLRGKAEVHCLAISSKSGRGTFHVPVSKEGIVLHLAGSLDDTHARQFSNVRRYNVELRTIDDLGLADVRFIKADVEGTERDVLDGGRETIMRDRPAIVLELLSGTHADPGAVTAGICADFGYEAFLVTRDRGNVPALPAIASLGGNSTYNTEYETRNVLFIAK
jgi:FkbM family methyltransferase